MSHSEITIFKYRWIIHIFIYYFTNILEKVIFNKWICDLVRFERRCTVKASMKHLNLFIKKILVILLYLRNGDNFPVFLFKFNSCNNWESDYLNYFLKKNGKPEIFFLQLISCQSWSFVEMSHRLEITSIFLLFIHFSKDGTPWNDRKDEMTGKYAFLQHTKISRTEHNLHQTRWPSLIFSAIV